MTIPVPIGGNGSPTDWWGPQDALEPIFPPNPTLGYVPPTPVIDNAPPRFTLWAFDSGWIGYIRNS